MLEGLDKIDWQSIRHYHGPATDVPKLLRDLLSKNKKTQSRAILELFSNIWHHGRVFEATAAAVPFLYEILESPDCNEGFSVLWLLGDIANGISCYRAHAFEETNEEKSEMIWAINAHDAVRQGVKTILGLLDDDNKDLRLPVVLLLASLREEAVQITPVLSSVLLTEKNPEIRAALGLALASLGDFHLEAFQSENTKVSLRLIETLARACVKDEGMRTAVYQTIEECLLSTVGEEDKDWLIDEKALLDSTGLSLN
jgi:hypothetical protein